LAAAGRSAGVAGATKLPSLEQPQIPRPRADHETVALLHRRAQPPPESCRLRLLLGVRQHGRASGPALYVPTEVGTCCEIRGWTWEWAGAGRAYSLAIGSGERRVGEECR